MLFNNDEIIILQSAIETYNEEPRMVLNPQLQYEQCIQILRKLDNLSSLTFFTKQEFTLMLLALTFIEEIAYQCNEPIDPTVYDLISRLLELAEPCTE